MKKFICLVMSLLLLTGCSVKVQYDMGIKEDKSVSFAVNAGFDEELLNAMITMDEDFSSTEANEYSDEDHWNYLENSLTETEEDNPLDHGFTRTRYESNGFKGFTVSKTIDSIDSITGDDADFDLTEDYINISESQVFQKEGNAYISKIKFSESEETSEYGDYNFGSTIEFVVTLPNKPISHNATSVSEDGKTLTWNLSGVETGNIDFTFEFPSFPYVLVIIGALAVIGVIAGIIIIVSLTKKKNNKPVNINDENVGLTSNMSFSPDQNVNVMPPVQPGVDNQQMDTNVNNVGVDTMVNAVPLVDNQPINPIPMPNVESVPLSNIESAPMPVQATVSDPVQINVNNNVQSDQSFSFDQVVVSSTPSVQEPVASVAESSNVDTLVVPEIQERVQPVVQPNVAIPDETVVNTPAVPAPPVELATPDNISVPVAAEPVVTEPNLVEPAVSVVESPVEDDKTINILE